MNEDEIQTWLYFHNLIEKSRMFYNEVLEEDDEWHILFIKNNLKIARLLIPSTHYIDGEIIKKLCEIVNIDGIQYYKELNSMIIEIEEKWK